MSCSKGGFIDLRHDEMRNTVAELLDDICIDVLVEPHLALLSGDHLPGSTIDGDDAWLDISARGFWQKGQHAFCDIRVFNLCHDSHEPESHCIFYYSRAGEEATVCRTIGAS